MESVGEGGADAAKFFIFSGALFFRIFFAFSFSILQFSTAMSYLEHL
jgi:hypothetical protein